MSKVFSSVWLRQPSVGHNQVNSLQAVYRQKGMASVAHGAVAVPFILQTESLTGLGHCELDTALKDDRTCETSRTLQSGGFVPQQRQEEPDNLDEETEKIFLVFLRDDSLQSTSGTQTVKSFKKQFLKMWPPKSLCLDSWRGFYHKKMAPDDVRGDSNYINILTHCTRITLIISETISQRLHFSYPPRISNES